MNRKLLAVTALLALFVIGLGAYVRLSDAGLGCPDWPGCYGHYLGVPSTPDEQAAAQASYPVREVHAGKAWKEMVHRYAAGSLGLLILTLCLQSWRRAARQTASPILPTLLLGLVCAQAALGMWTVTLLLKPVIVTLHLLGGMSTLALLLALLMRQAAPSPLPVTAVPIRLRWLAGLVLATVFGQIAIGGWVSSNYAALACTAFPHCLDGGTPAMDFHHAFTLFRELGETAAGQPLPGEALIAIHWLHRLGALLVAGLVAGLAWQLLRHPGLRRWGQALLGVLILQLGLGILNVLAALPLPIAIAHTVGAALLLGTTLAVNLHITGGLRQHSRAPQEKIRLAIFSQINRALGRST
ncbi:COX15/CtaA family protein [Dechloromonas sp. XY25]|uniref:COX15/CtaA family protein n=1 Tax=Dechloromonas hankyongensis TaxID=2908002 RepID=A0ABS9K2Q7_9RHOO|nr:COX15/CtaA family protein [Dechloromonas hankyongensis]MCG2577435.1 COX15/CtaA family protein [Dechloromonas hankyongensis]